MAETMSGLFGPSPYEVEQQRRTQMGTDATNFANMNATQRGVMGMYRGAGMLAGAGAEAMGMVDPAVANAQAMRQAAQGADTGTPEGLMEFAQKIQTFAPEKAAQAVAMARKMKADAAAAALAQSKEDRAQQKLEEVDKQRMANDFELKKQQLGQAYEIAKMRSEDSRLNSADRLAASREATAARVQMGVLNAEMKQLGIETRAATAAAKSTSGINPPKNLTREARLKWELDNGLIDQITYDTAMAGTAGGKAAAKEVGATKADQVKTLNFLKTAGYDPASGKDKIEELIMQSTGGGLERMGADVAGFFGGSTTGSRAISTLAAASNKLVLDMMGGKLGAGISNADRQFIEGQLGDVANPNKTREARLDAWRYARDRMLEVGLLPGGSQPSVTPPAPPAAPSTPSRSNETWVRGPDGKLQRAK